MDYSKKDKLFIDKEALITLSMMKEGLLSPVVKLMNKKEALEADKNQNVNGNFFPFSFILAPSGKINKKVLEKAKKDDVLELFCEDKKVGELITEEVFKIDPLQRIKSIYGSTDVESNSAAKTTLSRLGEYAISGNFWVNYDGIKKEIKKLEEFKDIFSNGSVAGITMHAKPIHRVHERIIRLTLEKNDLVAIFLVRNKNENDIPFKLRYEALKYVIDNFFPKNRVVIVPLNNTYIFAGINESLIDAIVVKNFGCNKFIVGQTHKGLGIHYQEDHMKSIFEKIEADIEVETINEFVYCDLCSTMVSTKSCPHGAHHHISYHSDSIFELLKTGIIPPSILMRKEVSAKYLSYLFPNRFENLQKLYYDIMPHSGIISENSEEDFYKALMNLYQTTSMN
jgi:sulfate adenylyltransferase